MNLINVKINRSSLVTKRALKKFERTVLGSLLGQAVIMLVLIVVYVTALGVFYDRMPDVLDGLRSLVGDAVYYSFALAPFGAILLFSTLPTAFRAWLQYRLSRQKFAWKVSEKELFRLYPYGADDQGDYKRPGGEDKRAVNWLKATPHSVNYLCGPSGVGKSSLVQACLLPRLSVSGWRTAVVRVDADPVERIHEAVLSVTDLPRDRGAKTPPLAELLATVSQQIGQLGQPPLLIVIDQFEEFLILNDAAARQPLADILRGLADSPLDGIRLLLVFRSDYRELLFKLDLPRFSSMENAFELTPFRRTEALGFLKTGGLSMSKEGFDTLLQGLDRIEGLRGLYRPITLNMVGLVMNRMPDNRIKDPSRLIELYLRQCLADGVSRDLVRDVLACMITAEGTKEPRRLAALGSLNRLDIWKVEATLCEMEIAGLVRSISPDRQVWEISHDFLARQIGFLLGRLRRPRLQRYAAPALVTTMVSWGVTIAVAVFLVWPDLREKAALDELAKMGFTWTAETGNHALILREAGKLTDSDFERFGQLAAALSEPVKEVNLWNTSITDLAPLKGMQIERLELTGADGITDFTPLEGMPLRLLRFSFAGRITDLTPLEGMPLEHLNLRDADGITDLMPLKNMPLMELHLRDADGITDLTPLEGMRLKLLELGDVDGITDLTPLKDMPLVHLNLSDADGIRDLTPLEGMPLEQLDLGGANGITDLTPLKDMPLVQLDLTIAKGITDLTPLKGVDPSIIRGASDKLLATMK